ncbi:hypothetical protein EVAR_66622_1, partial [Eumeta japonica]
WEGVNPNAEVRCDEAGPRANPKMIKIEDPGMVIGDTGGLGTGTDFPLSPYGIKTYLATR